MQSDSNILEKYDAGPDYSVYVDEASAIVKELRRSKMIGK